MKNHDENIIEKTLTSLEGIESAEVRPYFYTRLEGRLQNEKSRIRNQVRLAWITMCVMILANGFVYYSYSFKNESTDIIDPIALMSEEYNLDNDYSLLSVTE
jgi:hypothetical protein